MARDTMAFLERVVGDPARLVGDLLVDPLSRCGVQTLRIGAHHTDDPEALDSLLREELRRWLWAR